MTDDDLMRLARKHEGTDPSDDIPQVFALTPLELSALAKDLRRSALEEAWNICNANAAKLNGSKETASGYVALVLTADEIRALSQKDPQ